MWLQVLLISGLSLAGYAATRWLGSDKGMALTGLTGGLVSSTAVTLSFVQQAASAPDPRPLRARQRHHPRLVHHVRAVITEVLVVNRALVTSILAPFGAMEVVAGAFAWVYFRRSATPQGKQPSAAASGHQESLQLTAAAKFAAFFAAVLLIVKVVQQNLPAESIYVVAALAGLTDVDAIALSMAESAKAGDASVAVNAIVVAADDEHRREVWHGHDAGRAGAETSGRRGDGGDSGHWCRRSRVPVRLRPPGASNQRDFC